MKSSIAFSTKRFTINELSSTSPPNTVKVSELLRMRLPTFKKLTLKIVPTPGAPSPPKEIRNKNEFGSLFEK